MTTFGGITRPAGNLALERFPPYPAEPSLREIGWWGMPRPGLDVEVRRWRARNQRNLWRRARKVLLARRLRIPTHYGVLWLTKNCADGRRLEFGLASLGVVTDEGADFIVDGFQNLVEIELMQFHGFGTGAAAEAASDSALQTELTTEYATDNTRPTGSQAEGAATNVYRTVGTLDPDANVAITEHGIFTTAATATDLMLDRSVFSAINLDAGGDTLQATYDFTIASGG